MEPSDLGEDLLDAYLRSIADSQLLTHREEIALARAWRDDGDRAAWERLCHSNLRLVVSIAKRYQGYGVPFIDLIEEGNIGLMTACNKYDPDRGHRFSTYATWWIRQAVLRCLANDARLIRIPVHAHDKYWRLRRQIRNGEPVDPTDLERIEELYRSSTLASLSQPTGEDATLGELLPGDPDVASEIDRRDEPELYQALERLKQERPNYYQALWYYYGMDRDGRMRTLEETGAMLPRSGGHGTGLTRERVRQMVTTGVQYLKRQLKDSRTAGEWARRAKAAEAA